MLTVVLARDLNGGIGYLNGLPWPPLKPDMQRFQSVTRGKVVVMGRKTWESLPVGPEGRALPNRQNVVITRQRGYQAEGAVVFSSLEKALAHYQDRDVCIIGGAQVFLAAIPLADEIYETVVGGGFMADTSLDPIGPPWTLVDQVVREPDSVCAFQLLMNHYRKPPPWLPEAKGNSV